MVESPWEKPFPFVFPFSVFLLLLSDSIIFNGGVVCGSRQHTTTRKRRKKINARKFNLISNFCFFLFISAPPEITVEKAWVHAGEGHEAQLVCIVHGEANPEVNNL